MARFSGKQQMRTAVAMAVSAAAAIGAYSVARSTPLETQQTAGSTSERRSPVLVELFTSEGCSSCPPADQLLQELQSKQPVPGARVIAIGEHIDYFNYLGWKDPYSSAQYTVRQVEYRKNFRNPQVYTPQMIVDGQAEFLGSSRGTAHTAIARAAHQPKINISLVNKSGSVLVKTATLPRALAAADVYAAVTESDIATSVQKGENAGRRLTHTAVARQLIRIGTLSPGLSFGGTFKPETVGSPENQRVVVFVQGRGTRQVLGAEEISLADEP